MKTLYIIPSMGNNEAFYLADIQSGEVLASHFCSHELFAKGDLLENRPERIKKFKELYGEEMEAKFFDEQNILTEDEFTEKNYQWAVKEGIA